MPSDSPKHESCGQVVDAAVFIFTVTLAFKAQMQQADHLEGGIELGSNSHTLKDSVIWGMKLLVCACKPLSPVIGNVDL